MRIVDLISKKKYGEAYSKDEIDFFIKSVMDGSAPDYQISAWLMAVFFKGMNLDETAYLTDAMVHSGDVVDLKELAKIALDKHSTGGVADQVTLTLAPLLAACGVPIAKLSGRGLGHTGGTIDKLESIPGFNANLSIDEFTSQVKKINMAIGSQTDSLTPADGILYSLRDVTATIDSPPLVTSSVVSKKIASGADNIILDVKYGSGAFVKTPQDAAMLSEMMVEVGKRLSKSIIAVITSMEEPLGKAVGNAIEVIESIEFLKGNNSFVSPDLVELTYEFGAIALLQVGNFEDIDLAKEHLKAVVESGGALAKFKEFIQAQGGDSSVVDDYAKFAQPKFKIEIKAYQDGYVSKVDAYQIAYGCKLLGAGREKHGDAIDYSVGVYLNKQHGDAIKKGETLYTIYSNDEEKTIRAQVECDEAFEFSTTQPLKKELIYKIIR